MKTFHIFVTLLITAHVSTIAAQDPLPSDSADLIGKLESFEKQEFEKAQKAISEKRAAVAEILKSHMDRETRAGNLEAALTLKEKIASLSDLTPSDQKVRLPM